MTLAGFHIVAGVMSAATMTNNADNFRFLFHGLEEAGYPVAFALNTLHPSRINLFVDRVEQPGMLDFLTTGQVRYGIVCTEWIGADGSFGFGGHERLPETAEKFLVAIRHAAVVLCLLEGSVGFCRQINPRSYYLPFGHVEALRTIRRVTPAEREFDVVVTGQLTPRRQRIMRALRDQGLAVSYAGQFHPETVGTSDGMDGGFVPDFVRDSFLQRARLHLAVKKTDDHELISVSRLCHSVINEVPMLIEHDGIPNEYGAFATLASSRALLASVRPLLACIAVDDPGPRMARRLRITMPMRALVRNVIASAGLEL